jgi:hypothetical protein
MGQLHFSPMVTVGRINHDGMASNSFKSATTQALGSYHQAINIIV